jgi:diguanylate cyclase (GGDEF)-like protein
MPIAALPSTEANRLAAVFSYDVLDTAGEESFDDIVALASRLTDCPISAVSFVDAERVWFKARRGLGMTELHRDLALCAHAILDPGSTLMVVDATKDRRFADNPLVVGAPYIRSYLGVPLVNPDGHALGTLCVMDFVPRSHDEGTIRSVEILARSVVVNLELRRALFLVRGMALTDVLTGLPNRRAVMETLTDRVVRGDDVALILVDLDHFKEANDAEGHAAGDSLLCATADRLRASVRPGDLVGRIGGDEFAVLLLDLADQSMAAEIAQRISDALHRPVMHDGKLIRLGATLGVAVTPGDAQEPETAMRVADAAMVRAKGECRGTVGRASPGDPERLVRAAAIVRAFDGVDMDHDAMPSVMVHFQPIVSLRHDSSAVSSIIAVEALARWSHPDLGEVPPSELVQMIGLHRTSGLWRMVREQAFTAFANLIQGGLVDVRLALNLSASEVSMADIALQLVDHAERVGLSLAAVELEITEDVLLDRVSDRTLDQLAALRGRGARLVLDDFGTGNSGLSQLLRLPLDGLKLDQRFVRRLETDTRAEEIVRASVSVAHGMGLKITAEGVETEQQAAMLRSLGCDAAQGFLFARPMPATVLKTWLRDRLLVGHPA